jgi:hypothetical protein
MRRALIVTGLIIGLLIGAYFGFVGMLANAHDGYSESDAFRDYALWFFVYIPAGGALGYSVGRLNALLLDYMRQSLGVGIGTTALFIMTVVLTVLVTSSVLALGFVFYPLGY